MADMKTELAKKITSEAEFETLRDVQGYSTNNGAFPIGTKAHKLAWWAKRESLRLELGVYETSTPLDAINAVLPIFAHVSLQDPTRIAYTPDKQSGEQDRQLVISLGRFLTKHYPGLRDEAIQDFVATHVSELSNEVEFIEYDGIAEAYKKFGGTSACMSHANHHYGGFNPASAYEVPGAQLAVLRNKDGDISARCLVYHASETDKRYIRATYGDPALQKRLVKRGYKPGAWHGFKFKTIEHSDSTDEHKVYVMPYLDGNGTAGGPIVSMVALIDNQLTSVSHDLSRKLERLTPGCSFCSTNTSGRVHLRNIDSAQFSKIDYLTNKPINLLEEHYKLRVNGEDHATAESTVQDDTMWHYARTYVGGMTANRYMLITEIIQHDYDYYDRSKLEHFDLVMLDAEFGDSKIVYTRHAVKTVSGRMIRKQDAIELVSDTGLVHIHRSELVTTGKTKHIKIGADKYAMPGTKLYLTPSGRKVHPAVHDVIKLYDGMYEFRRNAVSVQIVDQEVWMPRALRVPYGEGSELHTKRRNEIRQEFHDDVAAGKSLSIAARDAYFKLSNGETFSIYSGYSRLRIDDTLPLVEEVSRIRAIASKMYNSMARSVVYEVNLAYAAMTAEEAPAPVAPAPAVEPVPVAPAPAVELVPLEAIEDEQTLTADEVTLLTQAGLVVVGPHNPDTSRTAMILEQARSSIDRATAAVASNFGASSASASASNYNPQTFRWNTVYATTATPTMVEDVTLNSTTSSN